MSSSNESGSDLARSGAYQKVEPVLVPVVKAFQFLFASTSRFLIIFGIALIALGAVLWQGTVAGHLGIYGGTAIAIGVLARLLVRWKPEAF